MKSAITLFCLNFFFVSYTTCSNYNEKLLVAARRKSEKGIMRCILLDACVNYQDSSGNTALMELAKGQILPEEIEKVERAVRNLIDEGANPYLLNYINKQSVFDIAKFYDNDFICEAIVYQLNLRVLYAASKLNLGSLLYRVDTQQGEVNCRDEIGNTPLIYAIVAAEDEECFKSQLLAIVNFLIERGANPYLINYETQMNAFDYAEHFGQQEVIKMLEKNGLHEIIVVA